MSFSKEQVLSLFDEDGLLSRSLKGFESRPEQKKMMGNIIDAYLQSQIALIEAGTGTGKSLAYLIPALIWAQHTGERTVISTNTISLQEQLIHKDIPALLKILNLELKAVLIKGMNNYVCLRKLDDALSELPLFHQDGNQEVEKIDAWKKNATEGSRSEIPFNPSAATWERVGAENDACQQHECPFAKDCFFLKARKEAGDAQILVANHYLLFSDLIKRAEAGNYGDTAIMPAYKRIVLDEAHHIEDIATEFFAERLSRLDILKTLAKLAADKSAQGQGKLHFLKDKLQSVFKKGVPQEAGTVLSKLAVDLPAFRLNVNDCIHQAFDAFGAFIQAIHSPMEKGEDETSNKEKKLRLLKEHAGHSLWKEELLPKAERLMENLKNYYQTLTGLEADLKFIQNDRLHEQTKSVRLDIQAISMRLEGAALQLSKFFSPTQEPAKVRWMESFTVKIQPNVALVNAELNVAKALVDYLFSKFATVILCSATLATNRQFGFIRSRLGLQTKLLPDRKIVEKIYDSPFDFKKQALLAIPSDIPPPSHPKFNEIAYENVWKAIEASGGQAFVLFTSYSMLKNCYDTLASRLKNKGYVLFKQGDENRQTLLVKFKETRRAVLFGTDSFWEGVDVAGEALRCVIIVKLPFKVPSEPIFQARSEEITANGGDPFFELSVPQAVVKFKQGFGRLIRRKKDRGCIICLDTRLITKGYGQQFLNSLPPCNKVFSKGEDLWIAVREFYKNTHYLLKN